VRLGSSLFAREEL